MELIAKATIQIQKPVEEVYAAITDPEKMTKYFISESSGPIETGKELTWGFPEFEGRFPVKNIVTVPDRSVSFVWDEDTVVHMELLPQPDHSTVVKVTEGVKPFNEENLQWVIGNTEGWANFLACLKAYIEYGVQLRKGAFEFMRKK